MIRGLPPEATLSAGRQSGGGAWMVKGEHIPGLTLALGQAASGDYPVEVYILETGDGPQATGYRRLAGGLAHSFRISARPSM